MNDSAQTAPGSRVAIIGAGPSGCYTAQALRKGQPDIEIALFDSKPTPFGLIRYGIAPDHQGAKAVTRQFDRLFTQLGVNFVGNVGIGTDIGIDDLLEHFDAVVVATGLTADRKLPIEQDPKAHVISAGDLIRLLNSDPDARLRTIDSPLALGEEIAILGTGNVAIDAARLLVKPISSLVGSDIDDDARDAVAPQPVRTLHLLGRCEPHLAKWDPSMLKELAEVEGVYLTVDGLPLAQAVQGPTRTDINVRFHKVPSSIARHEGRVRVTLQHPDNRTPTEHLDVDSVVTALGFHASTEHQTLFGDIETPRLFRVGGPQTGRLGNLAENRKQATETARQILAALQDQATTPPRAGLAGLSGALPTDTVSFDAWRRIDTAELDRARPDRCRTKFTTRDDLLAAARQSPHGSNPMATATATTTLED